LIYKTLQNLNHLIYREIYVFGEYLVVRSKRYCLRLQSLSNHRKLKLNENISKHSSNVITL